MTNLQTIQPKTSVADGESNPASEISNRLTAAASPAVADFLDLDEESFSAAEAACAAASMPPAKNLAPAEIEPEANSGGCDEGLPDSASSKLIEHQRSPKPASRETDSTLREAEQIAGVCREFERLMAIGHYSMRTAAAELGRSPSFFSGLDSMLARYRRGGVAGLLPGLRGGFVNANSFIVPPWFVPAAKFFYLLSNRVRMGGSVPEAVRRTISLPNFPHGWTNGHTTRFLKAIGSKELPICPPELREKILAREKARQQLVPSKLSRQIAVNRSVVQMFRSPRAWSLDNQSAPGSQRRFFNRTTNQREIMQPGDWFGGDDATPGIAVCVPCNEVITPASEKFGVLLGRFQWLAFHDCRTDKILAWDYVVRPRGSYRAEDILNGMGTVTKTHGIPRVGWQFEGGAWNSNLVVEAMRLMTCQHWRTYSPHQKAIESIFNRVWTRLAVQFPHADMGRYRAENEVNCKLYESCKKGNKDPRRYFPTLAVIVEAFEQEVAFHNSKKIFSEQYGQWVPDEFFHRFTGENKLREFSREMEWIFSPFAAERKIRGMMVRCRVPMFEDFSVPFEFNAPWMPLHAGKLVRMHFNPRELKCTAKIVLLENSGAHKPGDILGDANLIGETTGHIRLIMDWADDDQRAGYVARQRTANFMRRVSRGIGANGRVTYSNDEQRDGIAGMSKVEKRNSKTKSSERGDDHREQGVAVSAKISITSDEEIAELERRTKDIFT